MTRTSRAIVQTAPRTLELRELPLPEIGPDDALLQIEACGICGSDYEQYDSAVRAGLVVTPVRVPVASVAAIDDVSPAVPWGESRDRGRVQSLAGCGV